MSYNTPPELPPAALFGQGLMSGGATGRAAFGTGRKLASSGLRLLILALLAEKPRHGYEIIKALGERSGGFYVPSPGVVYPALTHLEGTGHATVEPDRARKLHHITEAGMAHLLHNRAAADALFEQFGRVGERMKGIRAALQAADAANAPEEGHDDGNSMELLRARLDLTTALAAKADCSVEEHHRVVEILKRATAKILGR